jgi:hypothetical protein
MTTWTRFDYFSKLQIVFSMGSAEKYFVNALIPFVGSRFRRGSTCRQ